MRKLLLFFMVSAFTMAQEAVTIDMKPNYAEQVYYKFSDNSIHSYDKNSWDIAFYRKSAFEQAIRINDGKGLALYEVSSSPSGWDNVDVSSQSSWKVLYNSDTDWLKGAFNKGSAVYGWGNYNSDNHHIVGKVVFVIKNSEGEYYKIFIKDYFYGYTFKYAKWNSENKSWDAEVEKVVPNSSNPNHYFNFFSLEDQDIVEAQPEMSNWDIVFRKYNTDLGPQYYNVTGALQNFNIKVAEIEGEDNTTNTATLNYSEEINTIGYNWKGMSGFTFFIEDKTYYLKYDSNDQVYKLKFTKFEGRSTGILEFNKTDMGKMSTLDVDANIKFDVYPNPVKDQKITIVYDNKETLTNDVQVEVYNMAGQKVLSTDLSKSQGFYQKEVNLGNISKGIYILKFIYGNQVSTKKLMVQ